MTKYTVVIQKSALKILEKINEPDYSKIKSQLFSLAENPRPPGCKKLKNRDGYRIRIGNYRILYDIFDKLLIIEVITLGHRKEIYD
jgi:mRNA interferase RelE/StbE